MAEYTVVANEMPPERYQVDLTDASAEKLGIEKVPQIVVNLEARKTMSGDLLIMDHMDIDIVIMPRENKIVAFPKENMHDYVYDVQNRLFHHLSRRGVVKRDSVQGGNVYGAIEGLIAESSDPVVDPVQMAIYSISNFIDTERPHFNYVQEYDDYLEKQLTDPGVSDSTELGEVPEEPRKGTIMPNARPYSLMYKMYEGKEEK
jgi:hypothetical protein